MDIKDTVAGKVSTGWKKFQEMLYYTGQRIAHIQLQVRDED